MNDLIERDRAMKVAMWFGTSEQKYNHSFIKKRVMEIPSARPKGEWKEVPIDDWKNITIVPWYKCTVCGVKSMIASPYCPNCGADMR